MILLVNGAQLKAGSVFKKMAKGECLGVEVKLWLGSEYVGDQSEHQPEAKGERGLTFDYQSLHMSNLVDIGIIQ